MLLKKIFLSFLMISLLTTISKADDSIYLSKGQTAPFSGYLLPDDEVLDLRNAVLERDTLKTQNASLNVSLALQNDIIGKQSSQVTILVDQNQKLVQTANSASGLTTWEKVGYIALGMAITYGTLKIGQSVLKW